MKKSKKEKKRLPRVDPETVQTIDFCFEQKCYKKSCCICGQKCNKDIYKYIYIKKKNPGP